MKRHSLLLRLVLSLFVAQVAGFLIAWCISLALGLSGFDPFETSLEEIASVRAKKQVIDSLTRNRNGDLTIVPTAELQAEMARAPGMKFAIFNALREPVPGSTPELVPALKPLIAISPTHVHFILPGDPMTVRSGLMEPQWTPFGRFHVAVYGQAFHWTDIFPAFRAEASWLIPYPVMVIVMSGIAAWFAVRWSLAPLRQAADRASRINMNSLHQRLDADDVSAEIAPFVEAVNGALARLDEGVARQRRFTANAAHELRTPVAILTARIDAPKEPTFLVDLERDAHRIRAIVEQMLSTARMHDGGDSGNHRIDLVETARAVVADAALLAIKSRRTIVVEHLVETMTIRGNKVAIESVIGNLLHNAICAEPEGGVIVVRVGADASIAVIDHGVGVMDEDREAIFEPFWRKNKSTPGTGLGLAISKELMENLGGRISVEETPGGGATFKLSFPKATEGAF